MRKVIYNTFPLEVIASTNFTKKDLAEHMGIENETFDYALPQTWLNHFVNCHKQFTYDQVRFTTFALYVDHTCYIVSCCEEIDAVINPREEVNPHFPMPIESNFKNEFISISEFIEKYQDEIDYVISTQHKQDAQTEREMWIFNNETLNRFAKQIGCNV